MSKKISTPIFLLSLFLFSYIFIRACLLSITWDEAYSYLEFVRNGIIFPEKYENMSANNHLLNTLLNIGLTRCFGLSELVLRLPSLFAHGLFLYFSYRLVKGFENKWLAVCSFIILNFNPYLLDFFSLSRGYGLSIGLMMSSIYFLYQFIHTEKNRYAAATVMTAGLAAFANFVLLNYLLVVSGLLLLLMLKDRNARKFIRSAALPVLVVLLWLALLVPIALKLKEAGALFYGGDKSFWNDTFSTIIDRCFYELGYNYWFQRLAKGFIIISVAAAGIIPLRKFLRKTGGKNNLFLLSLFFQLFFCSLSTVLQHYIFGTLYLIDRTALFLVVLFSLLLVFLLNELKLYRKQFAAITFICAAFALFHFALSFNFRYVLEWKWDADIKQMTQDLEKIKAVPSPLSAVSMGIPLEMDQGINFYRAKDHLAWLNAVERSDLEDRRFDYLFFGPEEEQKLNMDSMEILKRYPGTNNVLARPKYPAGPYAIAFREQVAGGVLFEIPDSVEYSQGFEHVADSSLLSGTAGLVELRALVSAPDLQKTNLYMIISFENARGCYLWKRACIKDFIVNENTPAPVHYSVLVPEECKTGDKLKAYIWNPNRHSLSVRNMQLTWLYNKHGQ
jgi:hypothetical protein